MGIINFTVHYNSSSIRVSWTSPFSLDVTGVDPDIWYSVTIYTLTNETTEAITCNDCVNLTDTHYVFTPGYISPCHKYLFFVVASNGAGQGSSSVNLTISKEK